jgi:6-phosphofructokinase
VEEAQRATDAAHVEASSAENGIGLVKLMGRYSGKFLAHPIWIVAATDY